MGGAGGKDETNETHTLEDEAQTNDPNQAPEKDATQKNKYVALASFLSDLGSRAAFIVPALLNGGTASFGLYQLISCSLHTMHTRADIALSVHQLARTHQRKDARTLFHSYGFLT